MTYSTLMVHVELGRSNAALLDAAVDVAKRFRSAVIGVTGCQPMQASYAEGYSGDVAEQEQKGIDDEIKTAEAEFRLALSPKVDHVEWRSTCAYGPVLDFLAHEARAADLVLTGVARGDRTPRAPGFARRDAGCAPLQHIGRCRNSAAQRLDRLPPRRTHRA